MNKSVEKTATNTQEFKKMYSSFTKIINISDAEYGNNPACSQTSNETQ